MKKNHIIKEPYASQIKEKLIRYATKNFTEEEKVQMKRQKEILSEYDISIKNN